MIIIEKIESYRIAYVRRTGPYGTDNALTMERLKNWAKTNNLLNKDAIILGIALDNPQTTKPDDCRYDTCIVIKNDYYVNDDDMHQGYTPGGKYAVFKINHTTEAVKKAWAEFFPELLNKGLLLDEARPIMERYATEMVNNNYCEICVPVK